MFGPDDQDVSSIAIGDDLLLQILGRVLAAQIRFERPAKSSPLLSQPISKASQFRTGIIGDLAGGVDLATNVCDLTFERRNGIGDPAQYRTAGTRPAYTGRGGFDRCEECREREQVERFERASLHAERSNDVIELGRRLAEIAETP